MLARTFARMSRPFRTGKSIRVTRHLVPGFMRGPVGTEGRMTGGSEPEPGDPELN